jgi:hypothetical protein
VGRVTPHVFTLTIDPDGDDPNLIEVRDRLPAFEAFGTVLRRSDESLDTLKSLVEVHKVS